MKHRTEHTDVGIVGAGTDRPELRDLRYAVAAAYYLDQRVSERLGYPGTVPRPVRALDYPDYLAEGLLNHLFADEPT